jgi:hypothetical protein
MAPHSEHMQVMNVALIFPDTRLSLFSLSLFSVKDALSDGEVMYGKARYTSVQLIDKDLGQSSQTHYWCDCGKLQKLRSR